MTPQEFGDLREMVGLPRIGAFDLIGSLNAAPKKSKYKAVRCQDANGEKFDSKAELRRWGELKWMATCDAISNLTRQPKFDIVVNGKKCGFYKADFSYTKAGVQIVEDVKGVRTPVYKLKKKLVEALYGITITEVR